MNGRWIGSSWGRARLRHSALFGAVWLVLAGCSAIVDTDKEKLGPVPVPCEPGQVAPCPCRDGSKSMQKCNAMARFDRCACTGNAGRGGSGSGSGTPTAGAGVTR